MEPASPVVPNLPRKSLVLAMSRFQSLPWDALDSDPRLASLEIKPGMFTYGLMRTPHGPSIVWPSGLMLAASRAVVNHVRASLESAYAFTTVSVIRLQAYCTVILDEGLASAKVGVAARRVFPSRKLAGRT